MCQLFGKAIIRCKSTKIYSYGIHRHFTITCNLFSLDGDSNDEYFVNFPKLSKRKNASVDEDSDYSPSEAYVLQVY